MHSRAIVAFLMTAIAMSFFATSASAQVPPDVDPEAVFERCVAKIRKTVNRCTEANADQTKECLRKIRALLEAGNEVRARLVARRCIDDIETRTRKCVASIHEDCRKCIEVLLRLEAPRLARRLKEACDNAVDAVKQNGRRSINAIKSAF